MGLFGGSSQSTSTLSSIIDFSPHINFGEGNTSSSEKTTEQTATTSPELDDSMSAAASVGVLGGTGGPASLAQSKDDLQPIAAF